MTTASLSFRALGVAALSVAVLSTALGGCATAKTAPATAEASPDGTRQTATSPSATGDEIPATGGETAPAKGETTPAAEDAAAEDPAFERRERPWMAGREWIMDEEAGRRYTIEKIPKIEKTYRWEDETHIRLPGGLFNVEVVKHDDDWFWVKIWEPDLISDRAPQKTSPPPGPTAAELEAQAAAYASDAGTADRIRLEPFDEGLPRAGQWRNGFDLADMNGDGHLDIVFGPSRKGRPRPNIFLGDGQGGWRRWSEARYPDLAFDYGDAAAADWNGDGHVDLAFGVHLRGILALVSDGKGGFEPWTEGIEFDDPAGGGDGSAYSSRAIEAIDWNGDGRPDLLALGEGPKGFGGGRRPGGGAPLVEGARGLKLYANQGDGTWTAQEVEQTPKDFGDDFALVELDGDGRPDVVVASGFVGNKTILRTSAAGADGLLAARPLEALRPGGRVTSVAAADFDGDGDGDLALGWVRGQNRVIRSGIDVYYAGPEATWTRRTLIAQESNGGVPSIAVGNLDGDGTPDLVALSGEGEVWVFLGDGEGFFDREVSPESPPAVKGCSGSKVRLADLDGDGRHEVVASFSGEPTGPAGLPIGNYPGCPGRGRISAWKAAVLGAEAAEEPAAARP